MFDLVQATPGWIIDHPWSAAGLLTLGVALLTSLVMLNPEGRQLRNLLRRKK